MIARISTLSFPLIFNLILFPEPMRPPHFNYKKNKWWRKTIIFFIKSRANCTTKCVKIVFWAFNSCVHIMKTTFLAGKAYSLEKIIKIKNVKKLKKFQAKNFKIKKLIIFSKFQRKIKSFLAKVSMILCSNNRKSSHRKTNVRNRKIL